MPSVDSSRIQTTGDGSIVYSNQQNTTTTSTETVETDTAVLSVTGLNVGGGHGLYAGSNGLDHTVLSFKTLIAGTGITLIENASTIVLYASNVAGGEIGIGGASDALHLPMGNATGNSVGSWSNGAVAITNAATTGSIIDEMNALLGLLIPSKPANFPNGSMTILNQSGNTPVLSFGYTNNTANTIAAGSSVVRIIGASVATNTFNDVGPSDSGDIQLLLNGNYYSTHTLTTGIDNGSYSGIVISDEKDYPPSTPGFWRSLDIAASGVPVSAGLNKLKINHTGAGSTSEVFFVRDSMTSVSSITAGTVSQSNLGTVAYSSSVPHYNLNGQLSVTATVNNISGETYYGGADPFSVTGTNNVIGTQNFTYSNFGISTPISKNLTAPTLSNAMTVNVDGSVHAMGTVQGLFKNVNGSTPLTNLASTTVLVKRGSASSSKVDEMAVPVIGLGSTPNANFATRIYHGSGDTPTTPPTAFVQSDSLPVWEAAVVGGQLEHCQRNFSVGYLPSGPDLSSGRTGAQYATFTFNRAIVSAFKINVTGTYQDCFVKLVGISDNSTISPHAFNGWWKAGVAYNGAGVPGNASDFTAGCAQGAVMNGASGSYTITFGPQSSSNATNNQIIVRFRLNAGQVITALNFSNV